MSAHRGRRGVFLSARFLVIALLSAALLAFVAIKISSLTQLFQAPSSTTPRQSITESKRRPVIVVFGDSLTERGTEDPAGWVSRLSSAYARKADVLNRGYNGYNTKWAIKYCLDEVIALKPDFVIIFFGANDAVFETVPQFVSVDEYKSNLATIVNAIKNALGAKTYILLVTPPQVDTGMLMEYNTRKKKQLLLDRSNERTSVYAKACMDVAALMQGEDTSADQHIAAADAFASLNHKRFLVDGLHLSDEGHVQLFELLCGVIRLHLPAMHASQIPIFGATWGDVALTAN